MDRWEGFTRGTMSGTRGSRRYDFAFENTANSADRNAFSGRLQTVNRC
jgi:hypothetical protein